MDLFKGCTTYTQKRTRYYTVKKALEIEYEILERGFRYNNLLINIAIFTKNFTEIAEINNANKEVQARAKALKKILGKIKVKYNHIIQCANNEVANVYGRI